MRVRACVRVCVMCNLCVLCMCVYAYICVCVHVCAHACVYAHMCVVLVCAFTCAVSMCIIYACVSNRVHTYVFMCIPAHHWKYHPTQALRKLSQSGTYTTVTFNMAITGMDMFTSVWSCDPCCYRWGPTVQWITVNFSLTTVMVWGWMTLAIILTGSVTRSPLGSVLY